MASFPKPPTLNDDRRAVDIYRKAALILREKGFEATSMGDIADSVDLTKGGLYYYIKGKEALLFAIMSFAMDEVEKRVVAPCHEVDDPRERIALWVSGLCERMLAEPAPMAVLSQGTEALKPEHRQHIEERQRALDDVLRFALIDLLRGDRTFDPEVALGSLKGMVEGVLRWYPTGAGLLPGDVVRQVTAMALGSLGLEPGGSGAEEAKETDRRAVA